MPRYQKPKKDVISCEKPRGGANIHYIRGFLNEETQLTETGQLSIHE